jgi:integrase
MSKRNRGTGSDYRRPGSRFYQIKFYRNGVAVRESTSTERVTAAKAILQQRLAEVQQGTYNPQAKKVTMAELVEAVLLEYEVNKRKSLDDAKTRWALHLKPVFGNALAAHVTSDSIERYQQRRLSESASNATINRELALLKRAFSKAMESTPPKIQRIPHFSMLAEAKPRTGFVEPAQYDKLAAACAKRGLWLRAMFECSSTFGWRRSELVNLQVRQVDLLNRTIHPDPGTTKNDEGRTVYMTDAVYSLLFACVVGMQGTDAVFTWPNGKPIRDFRGSWEAACKEAGLAGLLFHDLRRTAVRSLVRSGVSEAIAMKISGHKTRSVFERYNISSDADLREAALKVQAAREAQKALQAQKTASDANGAQFGTHSNQLADLPLAN